MNAVSSIVIHESALCVTSTPKMYHGRSNVLRSLLSLHSAGGGVMACGGYTLALCFREKRGLGESGRHPERAKGTINPKTACG